MSRWFALHRASRHWSCEARRRRWRPSRACVSGGSRSRTPSTSPRPSPSRCDGGRRSDWAPTVIPVVTPAAMKVIDAAAPEPVDVLIARAGAAVARAAVDLLDGAYGRRVVVVAGPGNNGADGRDAARRLRARGARVDVLEAGSVPAHLPRCDLVIDAAYGTGFHGTWEPPDVGGIPVLAVDIPSGVD